jgi:hypothetical protein
MGDCKSLPYYLDHGKFRICYDENLSPTQAQTLAENLQNAWDAMEREGCKMPDLMDPHNGRLTVHVTKAVSLGCVGPFDDQFGEYTGVSLPGRIWIPVALADDARVAGVCLQIGTG